MLTTLIHKPENLPSNIGEDGIPILSPRLYRSCAFDFPMTNTIQGVIDELNLKCYVEDAVQVMPEQIAVKARVDDSMYSASWIDAMFREGVHNMSSKIWKVSKYNGQVTSADADSILYKNTKKYHMTDFLEDSDEKNYIVYIIDMLA